MYEKGDTGYDFVLYKRHAVQNPTEAWEYYPITIDVKTRSYYPKYVTVPYPPVFRADIYVLCVASEQEVDFLGWTTAVNFLLWGKKIMYDDDPAWALPRNHLWDMVSLTDRLDKVKVLEGV